MHPSENKKKFVGGVLKLSGGMKTCLERSSSVGGFYINWSFVSVVLPHITNVKNGSHANGQSSIYKIYISKSI